MIAPKFGRGDEDVAQEEEDFENGKKSTKKLEACALRHVNGKI